MSDVSRTSEHLAAGRGGPGMGARLRRCAGGLLRLPGRLHRDQRGTISILSVFGVMLLAMLLGMVMNAGRQVDGKIRMQNAADAAAYSGGVVLARGMNTLVFTNHMLCDVFAITAFLREGRDDHAGQFAYYLEGQALNQPQQPGQQQGPGEQQAPAEDDSKKIFDAWESQGKVFAQSQFQRFKDLGQAVPQKVAKERQLQAAFAAWARAMSDQILPLMEEILAQEMIPQYQRAVVDAVPDVAQMAADEIARRNGLPEFGRGRMRAALWRTDGEVVGGPVEGYERTLPVVDPVMDSVPNQEMYLDTSRNQRESYANRYLNDWNYDALRDFDNSNRHNPSARDYKGMARMCQYGELWRSFTCGQLKQLLEEEYPYSNLPFVIRAVPDQAPDQNAFLESNYTFVAVAYWDKVPEILPGVFGNPTESDATAFAQVRVYIPARRLVWHWGYFRTYLPGLPPDRPYVNIWRWGVVREGYSARWDLTNQRWSCQLVPATGPNLARILQTVPPLAGFEDVEVPNLGRAGDREISYINMH